MQNVLILILLAFLAAWGAQASTSEPIVRHDFVERPIQFFKLTVTTLTGEKLELALTRFDTVANRFSIPFEKIPYASQAVRHRLIVHLLNYLSVQYKHILAGNGELDPAFEISLRTDHNLFRGRNTVLVLSELNSFYSLVGTARFAKPSFIYPKLPLVTQLKEKLRPLPQPEPTRVTDNTIKFYSFRYPEPHSVYIQNMNVYEWDINEVKLFTSQRYWRLPISAILFHATEELGAMSISRTISPGEDDEMFPDAPVLIVPKLFVAETDDPGVINLLLGEPQFTVHQEFPEGLIRKGKKASVLIGTRDQLVSGLYRKNSKLRAAALFKEISIEPMDSNPEFLRAFLPEELCTDELIEVLADVDRMMEKQRVETIREAEKIRPFPPTDEPIVEFR